MMTTAFLLPAESRKWSFYCLGLPLLPWAYLSNCDTHPCSNKTPALIRINTVMDAWSHAHTRGDIHAHTLLWRTRIFSDKCHCSLKRLNTHIHAYKRGEAPGYTFPSSGFSSIEIISPRSQTKPEITQQGRNLTERQEEMSHTHTHTHTNALSPLHCYWNSRH